MQCWLAPLCRALSCGGDGDSAWEIISAIIDFIYNYLPMFLLLILKSFLYDCMSLAGVPEATDSGTQPTQLQEGNLPFCRGSAGLLEKSYKCGTGLLLPLILTMCIFAPKPSLPSSLNISAPFAISPQAAGNSENTLLGTFSPRQWFPKP